ncbi:MAG: hypothetical protein M3Q63_03765 [bacterium]|nr:hypothetical protein [bacterium]
MGHVKIIQSGNKLEIFEYEKEITSKPYYRTPRKRSQSGDISLRTIRVDNSRRRIKSFRRLVTSNLVGEAKPSLLTLTMYEIVSLRRGYFAFHKFIRKLRKDCGKTFRYIAVPEFQKRGAVHFHCIIWGLDEKKIIKKEHETRYLQSLWQRGFLDCTPTDGHDKLTGYLAKYMSKSLLDDRLHYEKAFVASSNVLRPMSTSIGTALNYTKEIWGLDLSTAIPLLQREFKTQWLGKGTYRIFDI